LQERSAIVAGRMAGVGVGVGDRVLISCIPSVDLVIAHVAALRMGAIVVPVNTAYGSVELAKIIAQARPKLGIIDDPSRIAGLPAVTAAVELPDASAPSLDGMRTDDPALLMFTSGTTGEPKGVVLSHGNILSSAQAVVTAWQWTEADRLLLALPLFHMHGLGVGVHGTLLSGGSAVIVERFDVDGVLDEIAAQKCSMFFGVPTMWVRLAQSARVSELRGLRLCVSGSAALSPETAEVLSREGGQEILERYGMTETVMNISNPFVGERRRGSVGLALPGVSMRIEGSNGPGEIVLRGPNVMRTYWERPDATSGAFTSDGWFRTGDLGELDDDGYVRIVGRSKDLIISGGFNVYPREVEEALLTHPSIDEVAVAGIPHAEFGETVVAYVVVSSSASMSTDDVHQFAEPLLAKYKRPRHVVFLTELPKNALGKTQKHLLPQP
jgi:malonyl-CoA/methylmalonyl-CoA synthetase